MRFDRIENSEEEMLRVAPEKNMRALYEVYDEKLKTEDGVVPQSDVEFSRHISEWIGNSGVEGASLDPSLVPEAMDILQQMEYGIEEDGVQTLGLDEISRWAINDNYRETNIRQQAGYVAEVISTAKDNLIHLKDGTGITTFRADDRPDLFHKNNQYVDKVSFDAQGNLLEKTQVKFVGHDGESCLKKLTSKAFSKFFDDGKVDRIEIPADFYDEIRSQKLIERELDNLNRQLLKVRELNKTDVEEILIRKIERLNKIDAMLKRSSVTLQDAIDARLEPVAYLQDIVGVESIELALKHGFDKGIQEAKETAAKSSVEHFSKVIRKEESAKEAILNIVIDTGKASFIAARDGFLEEMNVGDMIRSSEQLIDQLSEMKFAEAEILRGHNAYDEFMKYAQGKTDVSTAAYNLGEIAARKAGKVAGGAAGAALGTAIPVAGTHAGKIVGAVVGTAVAATVYKEVVAHGPQAMEAANDLAALFKENATKTIELTKQFMPDQVNTMKEALNTFSLKNNLPYTA